MTQIEINQPLFARGLWKHASIVILSCEWKSNQEWLTKSPHAWLIEWKIPKMLLTSKIFVPVSQLKFTLIFMSLISHVCHFSFSNNFFHLTNSIFNLICWKCCKEILHGYQRKKGRVEWGLMVCWKFYADVTFLFFLDTGVLCITWKLASYNPRNSKEFLCSGDEIFKPHPYHKIHCIILWRNFWQAIELFVSWNAVVNLTVTHFLLSLNVTGSQACT